MYLLTDTLKMFADTVRQGKPVALTPGGKWKTLSTPLSIEHFLPSYARKRESDLSKHFSIHLDSLERFPVRFDTDLGGSAVQPIDYQLYIEIIDLLLSQLKLGDGDRIHLKTRRVAINYRLEGVNGGIEPSRSLSPVIQLTEEAAQWKKGQMIFWDNELNEGDRLRLEGACRYPLFLELIYHSEKLKDEFFNWIIRDGMPADVFVEYPGLYQRIKKAHLSGRIGRIGGHYLKMQKKPEGENEYLLEKIVTLPFEGIDTNILDPAKKVTFAGNYILSIGEVFHVFENKNIDNGNLEFMALGIMNWNTHCWGWWNADSKEYRVINLSEEDWWNELPVFEILSKAEAQRRYKTDLDGKKWLLMARASREYIDLHFMRSHAYLEVVVPMGGTGYSIYDFGKVVMKLPRNSLEALSIFGASIAGTISYPDENIYYTQRQHVGYAFELTYEEGAAFMDSIRNDMQKVREGHVVYQMETENCGRWIQDNLEAQLGNRVPNLFKMPVILSTPHGLMGKIFTFARKLPLKWGNKVIQIPQLFAGGWKGKWVEEKKGSKVWKSLTSSSFWKDGITHMPAHLHSHVDSKTLAVQKLPPTPHVVEAHIERRTLRKNVNDPFNLLDIFKE